LFHLAHPRAISVVKLGQRPVPGNVVLSVLGFYVLYVGTALLLTVANMAVGLDLESALGVTVATINLLGPGLGDVAVTFATVDSTVKWLGVVGMLAGRLEIFTLLILLLPAFWKA
jgi:trk system potassium uptake protein TrkH